MDVEQSQELDIKRYVQLVLKRRYLFAAVAGAIITVVVAASYLIPAVYEAKTVVSIEKSFINSVIKNIGAAQAVDDKATALSTIMKSRTLVYKVVSDLGLIDLNKMSEAQVEGLIKSTQDRTQIMIEFNKSGRKDVDFFTVSYRDRDPRRARDYVNNLVSRYIEENLSGKREDTFGANRFLLDQINHYKGAVAKLDADIAALRKDRNVMLHDRLLELQKRLDDLLVQYTESHPEVVRARAEIDSLRSKFRTRKREANADASENQPAETSSSAVAGASYTKNQIAALERERDANKKIYDELAAAYGKSEVSSQAEMQDKAGTFRIVDPAVLPIKPVSPKRVMIMLMGLAGGLAGAFGLLLALDTLNQSVKRVDEIRSFGIPVLAVIPHIESAEELIRTKRKDAYFYGLSGLFAFLLCIVIVRELLFG